MKEKNQLSSSNVSEKYLLILQKLPNLTSRLGILELSEDPLVNINLYRYFSELENYIFGVISQYSRIIENSLLLSPFGALIKDWCKSYKRGVS